jgi:capsular exopolysaccharide synthesis family protein
MSRIYDALKKAERLGARPPFVTPAAGRSAPTAGWDVAADARLEYERLQVWITNRSPGIPPIRVVMIASCQRGNGATTTATGLAATLARRDAVRVLIVDANLRTPALHRVFGARDPRGFSDLFGNGSASADYVQPTAQPNLFMMTSGVKPRAPLDVFAPAGLTRLVTQLKSRFDFIVLDAAPFLEFPDAYALAPHVDAVFLVVEADRTLVDDARRVVRELERSGVRAAGVVLNRQRDYTPWLLRRTLSRATGARASA